MNFCVSRHLYFNPRSPHGERRYSCVFLLKIHDFNPRSPHGERHHRNKCTEIFCHFNPRSPHGERPAYTSGDASSYYFNPRSPHGERRTCSTPRSGSAIISIHAPRTGSDAKSNGLMFLAGVFQSTLPARGATLKGIEGSEYEYIFQSTLPARGATNF